jgi:hypothetical protein
MDVYRSVAWSYDPKKLELDKETGFPFIPDKKELDLFKRDKTDMYKGTMMVCIVYGLSALILLMIIFFTNWGKTFVYNTFLPAIITYVVGAIFIITYLVWSVSELKPRQIGKVVASSVCPDYWRLEKSVAKDDLFDKIKEQKYTSSIVQSDVAHKCVPDRNIYGNTKTDIKDMKNYTYNTQLHSSAHMSGRYLNTPNVTDVDDKDIMYLYTNATKNPETNEYEYNNLASSSALRNYAEITGIYDPIKANNENTKKVDTETLKKNSLFAGTDFMYVDNKPLICSEVYPNILNSLEYDIYNKDKLKCEYAKACNVSWSHLDCDENPK